jgi:hypothetical protein
VKVTYRKGVMYFDEEAWALIIRYARKSHKTPKQIVIAALKRGVKCKTQKF